jgi:hypothetical protein
VSIQKEGQRDRRALEALAIVASAIGEPKARARIKTDRRAGIQAALAREKREITDLPEDVVAFFEGLSEDELETLGKLQETMLAARDKGFPSLAEEVEVNPLHTLAKL